MMNILDLLREKGLTPVKVTGSEWASACPSCGGRDRFRIWPEDRPGGCAWCRVCQWNGDNIQFARDFLGLDFKDACDHVGRTELKTSPTPRQVQAPRGPRVFEAARPDLPNATWLQRAAELVNWAHKNLLANPEQLAYLAGRGITEETARRFRLGWNPGEKGQDIYRPRETWGLAPEPKEDGKTPKRLWIPRGLVIPVYAAGTDNPVRIRIRRPKEHRTAGFDQSYIVLPGSTRHSFVTDSEARAFVIVEAELDAMLVSQELARALPGKVGAVALGSLAHKPDAPTDELLSRALAVLVALDFEPVDPDADPKKAANLRRIYSWWPERYPRAERWPVPKGKDPGDAYIEGCDIGAWVTAGLPPVLRLEVRPVVTVGPCVSGGAVEGCARLDVPAHLATVVGRLARHMATHGIVLRRPEGGQLLLPVGAEGTAPAALEEIIYLLPDELAAWLKDLGRDEVTAEMLEKPKR